MTTGVDRRSVTGNAAVLMASQVVTWAIAFCLAIVLPRYLGPAALGQLRLGVSVWTVAGVAVLFGTGTLLTKEFSRDPVRASRLIGGAATVQYVALVASTMAVGAFVVVAGYDRRVLVIVGLIGVSHAVQPFVNTGQAALYGLERMDRVAIAEIVSKGLHAVAVLLLIAVGADVTGIAAAAILPVAIAAIMMGWFLRRFGIDVSPRVHGAVGVARASRQYLAINLTLVAYQQVDVIVISLLVADRTLGWYSTADNLFSSLLFVPTILMTSLFPAMSRLHQEEPAEAVRMLRRSANLLLLTAVPVAFGTIAIANPVSLLLFGPEFAQTGPVLAVLGGVLLLTYPTILLGRYAIAIDRQRFWLHLMVTAVVMTIALDVVLVPWADRTFSNGAIGGGVAYLVTESFMVAVGLWKLAPELADLSTARRLARCLLAGGTMLAVVWPLRGAFIAVPIAVGVVTYMAMVAVLRIPDAEERIAMRALIERVVARLHRGPLTKVQR